MRKRVFALLIWYAVTQPPSSFSQTAAANPDRTYFSMLPSSVTVRVLDDCIGFTILEAYFHRKHPGYQRPTFRWSSTIGSLLKDVGDRNGFCQGSQPGHGQIVVEDALSGRKKVIDVTVLPAVSMDVRFSREITIGGDDNDLFLMFHDLCEDIRAPCGIDNPPPLPLGDLESLKKLGGKESMDEISRRQHTLINNEVGV